jgi:arylsulfatase A-like enzyme
MNERPNLLVILIDDLRFDEFGAGGHPYMRTPHVDRLAREGAMCLNAFHTTPLCSPNRASIVTGQYASRHGIIDNVARDAASHRLPNYHLELQRLGYETAHVGKWHMGNDGSPRPGYDRWVSLGSTATAWTSSTTSPRIPTSLRTSSTIRPARGSATTCGESSPGSWSRRSDSEPRQRPPVPVAGLG